MSKQKIVLYSHGGSGNHGCEAIVRGTVKILNNQVDELYSYRKEEDTKYGLGDLLTIKDHTKSHSKLSLKRIIASLRIRLLHDEEYAEKITYDALFENVKKGDVALSVGGDNYCYDSFGELALCNKYLNKKGVKTVLWGCSVEPSKITSKMKEDLLNYNMIYARETITYEALKKFHPNVVLNCDPAFYMESTSYNLNDSFKDKEIIGLNFSPVVMDYSSDSQCLYDNVIDMIDTILTETNYSIMLVPHVYWDFTNDYTALKSIYDKYSHTGRIILIEEMNAEKLKGAIQKCKMFIGARTHSTIAAYSMCIPTLVIGYSVKALGIAKDIFGTSDNYVIPTQSITSPDQLSEAFRWLNNNYENIKQHMESKMPEYVKVHDELIKKLKQLEW